MASDIPTEAIDIHNELVYYLGTQIVESKLHKLKNLFRNNPLTPVDIDSISNIYDLFDSLMRYTKIAVGEYTQLVRKLKLTNPDLERYVIDKEKAIKSIINGDPTAVIVTTADTSQAIKIHPELEPMIETAKARIKKEKEDNKFYPTKGFCDAKEKLQKNRVVFIKGNMGDGKTTIAVQLLHWLSEEQGAGQPLQLHKIKKLDLLAPNLKLIAFIDDIFGENDVCKKDVQEWNKRISDVETLFVDKQTQPNFLIITIRNEVFNSLGKRSLGTILTKDNIIDLSSQTYKLAGEKKGLLELYKPKYCSWTDKEIRQISTYAPNIGFPQCCKLFYNSEELQKDGVRFFENPFHFLNEALSRLKECSALLYLFLNDGMIRVVDLDPNSEKVNETLLEQAFSIKLIGGKYHTAALFCDKIGKVGFIKDSFDELLGFLVKKEKQWFSEDVYRFNHDSIYVAVACLYGKATPIGYIQNCPSKSLTYLTTSKTATNMIVISSDQYTDMCERLLREFECEEKRYGTSSIACLDVWNDPVFVERFVRLLKDRKVDKLAVLNKACYFGAEECVLYLLSEGVKPDKDTALWSLISGHRKDSNRQVCLLRKIVVYLNNETKLAVLNKACSSGAEECVLYLLSEGVKPYKYIRLWPLIDRHRNDSNRQVCLLRKVVVYLNDETKLAVLNKACSCGADKCALYLLAEGVEPDKNTDWWSLIDRHWNDSNRLVCLLRNIVVYLNDETKLDVLNIACYYGAEECVLYLLSEGVEPDKNTDWLLLVRGYWNDSYRLVSLLRNIVVYLNDETKLAVLNKACSHGAEECVLYLLSEGVKPDKYTALSLVGGYWNDRNRQVCLLQEIVVYLNDETKLAVLNKACLCGAEECVVYLLSEGVKPDKYTAWRSLIYRHLNDSNRQVCLLRKIVVYLNDETKVAVLNMACLYGAEECALYLLSEGVKPDKDTAMSLVRRYWKDSNRQVCLLRTIVVYLNDETKLAVLNKACSRGAKECVLYLLSEGVKPNKYTKWWSLIFWHWNDNNRQVCLLRKIVVYLNNETKVAVLNEACSSGTEDCVLYLLSEGVKPNKYTAWWSLIYRHWNDINRQVCLLRKINVHLNDETKVAILNEACARDAEECALYLLSEGVKPDKDTALSLVGGYWKDSNRQVCLLRKIDLHLDDETKVAVLNEACARDAEECASYLLSEGVKPDKDTALALVNGYWKDRKRQMCLLRKIVVHLNEKTKVAVLNEVCSRGCSRGAEACVLYLLCEGVEPDEETVFCVVKRGRVKSLRKLLQYDVTPATRGCYNNVLHVACRCRREERVAFFCDTYPRLVHDTDDEKRTPFYVEVDTGHCSMFQTLERFVLNSLYRVEDQQHKCESVDGRIVHRNCVCVQYMAQLVDVSGKTVLHWSWLRGNRELCLYLCQSYPALTTAVDKDSRHCLHYIAESERSDVLYWFTKCENHVKQYLEYTRRKYDITTIFDNDGRSVLDMAKEGAKEREKFWGPEKDPLVIHLVKVFGK